MYDTIIKKNVYKLLYKLMVVRVKKQNLKLIFYINKKVNTENLVEIL